MMDYSKTWNIIVSQFNAHKKKEESHIQLLWEKLLSEKFGYSSFDNEIISQKKIPIGSNSRALIPDIVLCKDGQEICAIELKTEETKLTKQFENQLFSYLKQEKLRVGILICDKIYVYNYEYFKNDDSQDRIEIPFDANNIDGQRFVELLHHDTFSIDNFNRFVLQKLSFLENVQTISNSVSKDLIHELLLNFFVKKFSKEEVAMALKSFDINISSVVNKPMDSMDKETPQISTHYSTKNENGVDLSFLANGLVKGGNGPSSKLVDFLKESHIFATTSVCTVAKINKNQKDYWANPSVEFLNKDWNLVLNDINKRELHIFYIPANSINLNEMKVRKDKPQRMNLGIIYNNPNFQCHISKYNFIKWYKYTMKY